MPPINLNNAVTTYNKIASSTTATDLSVENGRREGLIIYNNSTANLFLRIDGDATTTDWTMKLPPDAYYEMTAKYFTDRVSGVWDAANGYAMVTEISK